MDEVAVLIDELNLAQASSMGISPALWGLTSSHGEWLVSGAGVGRHALTNANASCRVASSIFGSQVLTAVLNAASAPEADVGRTDAVFVSVPERTRARYRCLRSFVLARTFSRLPSSSIEGTAVQDTSACDVDSCLSIYIASCASDFIGHSMRDGIVPTYTCLLSRQQNGLTGSVFPDD